MICRILNNSQTFEFSIDKIPNVHSTAGTIDKNEGKGLNT